MTGSMRWRLWDIMSCLSEKALGYEARHHFRLLGTGGAKQK